jgi:hypothetical protein
MGPLESVADFYTSDVAIQEFPNHIAPRGRVRRAPDIQAAYEPAKSLRNEITTATRQLVRYPIQPFRHEDMFNQATDEALESEPLLASP